MLTIKLQSQLVVRGWRRLEGRWKGKKRKRYSNMPSLIFPEHSDNACMFGREKYEGRSRLSKM